MAVLVVLYCESQLLAGERRYKPGETRISQVGRLLKRAEMAPLWFSFQFPMEFQQILKGGESCYKWGCSEVWRAAMSTDQEGQIVIKGSASVAMAIGLGEWLRIFRQGFISRAYGIGH